MKLTDMNVRESANSFEAVKIGLRQNKEGVFITLLIHPSDVPQDLVADLVGTRYMVAAVKINDQGEPVPGEKKVESKTALAIAQALPRNVKFQRWTSGKFNIPPSEEDAVDAIRSHCGISSRSEFATNEHARKRMFQLRDEFEEWLLRR